MFGFLSVCMFAFAFWLNKKLKGRRAGLIALLVGLAGSMLLYRSPLSSTLVSWADGTILGAIAGTFGGWSGEGLSTSIIWSVLCIVGFVMTIVDLRYDHTYNPVAITALIITPIAAKGSAGGVVTNLIDWVHTQGAGVAAWLIGGAVA
jgi:hypothetical protein